MEEPFELYTDWLKAEKIVDIPGGLSQNWINMELEIK